MAPVEYARMRAVSDRLVDRVAHWTPARWVSSAPTGHTRAQLCQALVQRLAELAADAEQQPRRMVPPAANPLSLPDQLRVMTTDLLMAGDQVIWAEAVEVIENTSAQFD